MRLLRRLAYYLALTSLAGVILGLAGEWMDWSNGISFAATVAVGMAISMAAVRDTLDLLRATHDGRGKDPRPSV